jgi:hypothetical protein
MHDIAKAIGHKGRRQYGDEGRPQHRRKGGGREITNSARRNHDKAVVADWSRESAICPTHAVPPGYSSPDGVSRPTHEFPVGWMP